MRLRPLLAAPVLALAFAFAAACGGAAQPPATPQPSPSAAPEGSASAAPAGTATAPATPASSAAPAGSAAPAPVASVPAPSKPWDQMNHKERLELMKTVVLPNMKTAFQAFDSKSFADFNCATCHGERIKKGNFDMPNPALPKLDFKNQFKDDMAKHPDTVKFMGEVVAPQMTTMLGAQPFDMKTMKGFGCAACHTGK